MIHFCFYKLWFPRRRSTMWIPHNWYSGLDWENWFPLNYLCKPDFSMWGKRERAIKWVLKWWMVIDETLIIGIFIVIHLTCPIRNFPSCGDWFHVPVTWIHNIANRVLFISECICQLIYEWECLNWQRWSIINDWRRFALNWNEPFHDSIDERFH